MEARRVSEDLKLACIFADLFVSHLRPQAKAAEVGS